MPNLRNVLVLTSLIGAFYLCTLRSGQRWDDDFAMYVHEAKNIALGLDYTQTGYIYQTEYAKLGPRTYPPGFPLLLAGVYKVFGLNLTAMKMEMVVLFLGALVAIALAFQRDLSEKQLLALVAMIGFSPFFWNFKEAILSDIPFLLLAYLALFLIHRDEQARCKPQRSAADWNAVLAGLAMFAAYSTRTVGICLLAALWLRDAIRLRKLSRFTVIATLVFVPGAALEAFFGRAESSYADQLGSAPAFVSHAVAYFKSLSVLWDNGYSSAFRLFAFALLGGLALAGFAVRLKNKVEIFETFAIVYMGILLLWPPLEDRFLIPLFPICMFYVLTGLQAAVGWASPAQRRAAAAFVAGVICLSYAARYTKMDYGPLNGVDHPQARALFDFVATRTKPSDRFIFRRPRALALFSGRSSASYWGNSDEEVWKSFCDARANYVIAGFLDDVTPPTGVPPGFLNAFVKKHSQDLREVYANPSFTVYRIERPCGVTTTQRQGAGMPDERAVSSRP